MSFASKAKDELTRQRLRKCEKQALLFGATCAAGTLVMRRGRGIGIKYVSESHAVARLVSKLASELYNVESEVTVHETNAGMGRNIVLWLFGSGTSILLSDSGLMKSDNESVKINEHDTLALRAFVRGVFLMCGSINNPNNSYHLEMVCHTAGLASRVIEYSQVFNVALKHTKRNDSYIVYIKDSEIISDFLKLIGAINSTLELENVKSIRDVRNYVNRTTNCDIANLQKVANASTAQIEALNLLFGLDIPLPQKLRETAIARIENPDASLSELSDILGIGRSGVNHRLKKLMELAEETKNRKGVR